MTEEDTEAFVKKQAEKLTESSDDVSEQAQGSEKQWSISYDVFSCVSFSFFLYKAVRKKQNWRNLVIW